MLEKYQDIELLKNEELHRFELNITGSIAFIEYKETPQRIYLLHTEVPKALEGQGVAGALVEKTFQYIENNGLKLVPYCPYIISFLKRHPEWQRIRATN